MRHKYITGIDISDTSIKILQLDQDGNIVAFGKGDIPEGVLEDEKIVKPEEFSAVLKDVLTQTKPKALSVDGPPIRAIISLPESKIFTHFFSVPSSIKGEDLEKHVQETAQTIIPFEFSEIYWDYHVFENNGERRVTFIGVAKEDLNNYVEAFMLANVRPVSVSSELLSLGRSTLPDGVLDGGYLIIDIGAHSTTVGFFFADAITNASVEISLGGHHFTQSIEQKLGISYSEAEKQKREYGLDPRHENTNVPAALKTVVNELMTNVKEAKLYFEKKIGSNVSHVVLSGGSALMPGIVTFVESEIGTGTKIADPLSKIKDTSIMGGEAPGILFASVIGLALSGTNQSAMKLNLLRQYRYDDDSDGVARIGFRDIESPGDLFHVMGSELERVRSEVFGVLTILMKGLHAHGKLIASVLLVCLALAFLVWVLITYT